MWRMTAFAKSCQDPWQIRVVGTSYSPHHMAMNEFVDPSQQPTDNPRRRSTKWFPEPDDSRRSNVPPPPLSELDVTPAAPAAQPDRSPLPTDLDVTPAAPADRPPPILVWVVWYGGTGEVAGARVWNPKRQADRSVRPTGTFAVEVRQAFAQFLAEDIIAAIWPVPHAGMSSPASNSEMLNLAEKLLDPRILAAKLVEATVQLAAAHAGIPLPFARMMGQAARDLFLPLATPDPKAPKVQAVQYVDLTLSAEDGSVLDSPALPQIAAGETADAINALLGPRDLPPVPPEEPSPVRQETFTVRQQTSPVRQEPSPPVNDPGGFGI